LKDSGTVTMPSADAMAQASPAIIDRFQAIKKVDLSGMSNLAGNIKDLPQSITDLNLTWCKELEGDIEVLKGMNIKNVNLEWCGDLSGTTLALASCPELVELKVGAPKSACLFLSRNSMRLCRSLLATP